LRRGPITYPTPFIALAPPSVLRSIVQHGDGFRGGDPVGHKSFHQVVEPVLAVLDLNFLFCQLSKTQ